jgi:hypothetical protein
MLTAKEMAWLHDLQEDLALRRDWVSVAYLQCVIDRIVDEHPAHPAPVDMADRPVVLH